MNYTVKKDSNLKTYNIPNPTGISNIKSNYTSYSSSNGNYSHTIRKHNTTNGNYSGSNNSQTVSHIVDSSYYSDTNSEYNYYPDGVISISADNDIIERLKLRQKYQDKYDTDIKNGSYIYDVFKYPIYYFNQKDFEQEILENPLDGGSHKFSTSGCGVVAMATVISTFLKRNIEPTELSDVVFKTGSYTGDNNGTYIEFIPDTLKEYGLDAEIIKNTSNGRLKVLNALKSGNALVMVNVRANDAVEPQFTLGGHFMILADLAPNGDVYVVDPNDGFGRKTGRYWSFNKNIVPQLQTKEIGCFVIVKE